MPAPSFRFPPLRYGSLTLALNNGCLIGDAQRRALWSYLTEHPLPERWKCRCQSVWDGLALSRGWGPNFWTSWHYVVSDMILLQDEKLVWCPHCCPDEFDSAWPLSTMLEKGTRPCGCAGCEEDVEF